MSNGYASRVNVASSYGYASSIWEREADTTPTRGVELPNCNMCGKIVSGDEGKQMPDGMWVHKSCPTEGKRP